MKWNTTRMERHEQVIFTRVWMDLKCFMVTETGKTQSLHPLLFHLYSIVEKVKLYGHRTNQ